LPRLLIVALIALPLLLSSPIASQPFSACGVVDAIDYPLDVSDAFSQGYDDFGVYRPRFGGNHVGVDIGFERWGEPIRAAARGRVTLANLEEWDTEKGVVILEHTFPDGSIAYSLYGHVDQGEAGMLPVEGACVERGDVIALEGWPSRGKPHLHYEIRSMLPGEGGPGYIDGNPLEAGWYHPFEFTELWRARLQPGFVSAQSFTSTPTLPPALLDDGSAVLALGDQLVSTLDGVERWRISLGDIATGQLGLSEGRVTALARGGQAFTLQNGRFLGAWPVDALEISPVAVASAAGEALVFVTDGGGLTAFTPAGTPLWTVPALEGESTAGRVLSLQSNGAEIGLVVRSDDGPLLRLIRDGALLADVPVRDPALLTPMAGGGWLLVDGPQIDKLIGGQRLPFVTLDEAPGRGSQISLDPAGGVLVLSAGSSPTLTFFDAAGAPRWTIETPRARTGLSPLLAVGGGCLVYTLDADGALRAYHAADGELAAERDLYAGGNQSGNPRARLLVASPGDQLTVGAGFLSVARFDGLQLGETACSG
jgi:murein DD-endopeptidase MepM/ murein hydrolase activator NlpD